MAAGAFGAGSLPGSAPAGGRTGSPWTHWPGIAAWLAGTVLLAATWWRLGAARHDPGAPVSVRWLLVTGVFWAAPLLVAPPLGSRDIYAYACQGAVWLDGADPYTVGVADAGCPWVDAVSPLWRETPTPYGPLAVALAGAVVAPARAATASEYGQLLVAVGLFRAAALAGGLLLAVSAPRVARACGADPVAALWLGLVSPLVALHVVSGAHNDALMVGLALAALALVATAGERRPGPARAPGTGLTRWSLPAAAGVALGLAVAVKVTAVVAVPFVVLLAAAGTPLAGETCVDRHRALGRSAAAVGSGGLVVFAGLTVATGLDLGWVAALPETGRVVQWTSLPTGLGMAAGYLLHAAGWPDAFDAAVAVARLIGSLTLLAVGLALVVCGWRRLATAGPVAARRAVVTACGLAFAALALLSPAFYPWYGLAAVAVLGSCVTDERWLRRLAAAVLVLSFLVLPDGLGVASLTKLPGALLDLVVVGALVGAARRASRKASGRDRPVRAGGGA